MEVKRYQTFEEFYPYYLSQHANLTNRRLHIIGTFIAILHLIYAIIFFSPINVIYGIVTGYALAWVGHFFFEKNKPATFQYPLFSLKGDVRMVT